MVIRTNYHTHSKLDDGKDDLEDYVKEAVSKKFTQLGFSGHYHVDGVHWTMTRDEVAEYVDTVDDLKKKYNDRLIIQKGMEVDYIPGIISPTSKEIRDLDLDYTIGSVHFIHDLEDKNQWPLGGTFESVSSGFERKFGGDIRKAVERFYELVKEMVRYHTPSIVGHFDLVKIYSRGKYHFNEDMEWYRNLVHSALMEIDRKNCIIEINTGGILRGKTDSIYPSEWVLKEIRELNIPITVNSDAHRPADIDGYFAETEKILKIHGFDMIKIMSPSGWIDDPI